MLEGRLADDARAAVVARLLVGRPEPVEAEHREAAPGALPGRGAARRAEARDHDVERHAPPRAMHSISTFAPKARPLAATVERAGGSLGKNDAYTWFIAA